MRHAALSLALLVLAVACGPEPDRPIEDASVPGIDASTLDGGHDAGIDAPLDAFVARREGPCTDDDQCFSGVCRHGTCAMPCSGRSDCPTVRGWACSPGAGGRAGCTCEPSTGIDACSDDVDSDCDGSLDRCLVCDGHEVTADDASNCGGCGVICAPGASCISASCLCDDAALSICGGRCVDLQSDVEHCGGCDRACPPTASCAGGACVCPGASDAICGGACVDVRSSTAHCGGCDAACADGELCIEGTCRCPDASQRSCPGAGCVDLAVDPLHCGACGAACPSGATCASGTCACPADRTTACGGSCADLATDPAHCGACDRACPSGIACVAGVCACPGTTTACGPSCVDTSTSTAHCGGCGRACAGRCVDGGCIEPRAIGAGSGYTCVLLRDGRVLCWGANDVGQLGSGTEGASRWHPEPVLDVDDATFLSVGRTAACVIRPGNELWCWGEHGGSTRSSNRPVRVDDVGRPILHVSVGDSRTCVVSDDGAAHCWGPLGAGRFTAPGGFAQIATGEQHTCGLTTSRAVYCWGSNVDAQLGLGTRGVGMYFPEPVLVSGMPTTGVEIDAGHDHTCVRTSSRDIWCWGNDTYAQASGDGPSGLWVRSPRSLGDTRVAWRGVFIDLDTGSANSTCGATSSGTLVAFGDVLDLRASPSFVTACAVGASHGCAIRAGSTVSCWGTNALGELGGGTTAYESDLAVDVIW